MTSIRIRLKCGPKSEILSLPADSTAAALFHEINQRFSIPSECVSLKIGFPPKEVSFTSNSALISSLISSGQQVLVEEKSKPKTTEFSGFQTAAALENQSKLGTLTTPATNEYSQSSTSPAPNASDSLYQAPAPNPNDPPYVQTPEGDLVLRIMPDDNSCLFRALATPLGVQPFDLRKIVAETILSDPFTYSEAVLGKAPQNYAAWIQKESSWGGYIELSILSKHFDVEFCSADVQTGRIDSYNSNPLTGQRIWIMYSGIHYDLAAIAPILWDTSADIMFFDCKNTEMESFVKQLAALLRQKHYYTDTGSFSIRCNTCGTGLKGEKEASAHAMQTGHTQFGEF
ncbi:ubiquitin-specific protease [Schizosaccharomyces japonicus yFS275]|uniref:Ubiquitin thioesterase OTU n=1 Tax=Schizosaccharomyces japonicus (strain yFS275 / FY16936) TaxID=402676 RepID=B6JYU8_SCHJY|nr:ubiquitin-specific protease [Schizosaccharomyces japonicus yFS275]EEB06716.1 ubiquitin-specific protease [Schizosaccharomyces japonicus yFS275]